MGNKKIRRIIQKSNEELLDKLRKEILKVTIVGTSKAIKQSLRSNNNNQQTNEGKTNPVLKVDFTGPTSKMIGDLYERMSGTSSEGESYTFAVGKDATLLASMQNKLLKQEPISRDDAKKVYDIYKRFFASEAEKIKL